jgi:hypothetical protein
MERSVLYRRLHLAFLLALLLPACSSGPDRKAAPRKPKPGPAPAAAVPSHVEGDKPENVDPAGAQPTSVRTAVKPVAKEDGEKEAATQRAEVPVKKAPSAAKVSSTSNPSNFAYAGAWRGHKKKGGTGMGAVTLIAPSWGITAAHVASKKANTPEAVNVTAGH